MTQEENILTDHLKEVRCKSIDLIRKAANELWSDPDNPTHCRQIHDCLQSYMEAQLLLNPNFFGD